MEGFIYRSNGKAIDKTCSATLWKIFQMIEDEAEHISSFTEGATNLREHITLRFKEETAKVNHAFEKDDVTAAFNCFMNYYRFHQGGYIEELGIDGSYVSIPGGDVKIQSGK